jgi:hypothetical protein
LRRPFCFPGVLVSVVTGTPCVKSVPEDSSHP